jgi:septum formation protein
MMEQAARIILASASPRRRDLLAQLGLGCRVIIPDVDERPQAGEPAADYVLRLARAKARAGARLAGRAGAELNRRPVLAADTAVVIDDRALGKPTDADDAIAMLSLLSGREHQVMTAVAVVIPTPAGDSEPATALSTSRVRFRGITTAEAAAYWATGEPADKAGGYAIQGVGAVFVEALQGSFSGVVGLPLFETAQLLTAAGVRLLPTPTT